MLILITLLATFLAIYQNLPMLGFGLKEMAIFAFPLSFVGILALELLLLWVGYFVLCGIRKKWSKFFYVLWAVIIIGGAEWFLPASSLERLQRKSLLDEIQLVESSFDTLRPSTEKHFRFALNYTLKFSKTGHYLTFPAYVGTRYKELASGYYFKKKHPEYLEERFLFRGDRQYDFTIVFESQTDLKTLAQSSAHVTICDDRHYNMACRTISIPLVALPRMSPDKLDSTSPEPLHDDSNIWARMERGIRIADLTLKTLENQSGFPVEFSYSITNVSPSELVIPEGALDKVISMFYAWEPLSEEASRTVVREGVGRFGKLVVAGGEYSLPRKERLASGEKILLQAKIQPSNPFEAGKYRLHVNLRNRYSTFAEPVQKLSVDFLIIK